MSLDLLAYSKGGGCGCKIDAIKLSEILSGFDSGAGILVDLSQKDDASVMELGNGECLIQTLDFFLPVVSDPYDFGRIAAANAISDVYAMGGHPVMALSILGWPVQVIPVEYAKEVLRGAEQICREAGIGISGGHSIETSEPLFGLSVSGLVKKENLKRKSGCKPGDFLYLTKPLGLGLLANALKQNKLGESAYKTLIGISITLNSIGESLGKMDEVSALTDVTGFGLLGHLSEMLGENYGARLFLDKIPVIDEAVEIAKKMQYPNITTSNYNFIKDRTDGLNGLEFLWLCDPQTSGGLLFTSNKAIHLEHCILIGEINDNGRIAII